MGRRIKGKHIMRKLQDINNDLQNDFITSELLQDCKQWYLSYFTSCLSLDRFANLYNIPVEDLERVLELGKGVCECEN